MYFISFKYKNINKYKSLQKNNNRFYTTNKNKLYYISYIYIYIYIVSYRIIYYTRSQMDVPFKKMKDAAFITKVIVNQYL